MQQNDERDFDQSRMKSDRNRVFNLSAIVTMLIVVCAAIHVARTYLMSEEMNFLTLYFGAFIPARYTPGAPLMIESITSPVTYSLLHGSFTHLLSNSIWLAAFGSPLASTIGAIRFILFWIICSIIAALFHFLAHMGDMTPMIGASGAVAGCMGAAARFGFSLVKKPGATSFDPRLPALATLVQNSSVVAFLTIFLLSNLLIGSGQFSDGAQTIAWQAHLGGVAAGFLLLPFFLKGKKAR